jgi:hypothetical protein
MQLDGARALQPMKRLTEEPHPPFDNIFWSIASTECGEIPSSTNPGFSGDDMVSICISST